MANRIKGITVEIGGDTTGLDKALSRISEYILILIQGRRALKIRPGMENEKACICRLRAEKKVKVTPGSLYLKKEAV